MYLLDWINMLKSRCVMVSMEYYSNVSSPELLSQHILLWKITSKVSES